MITDTEKEIIKTSVECSLSFGTGILTNCKRELRDEGFKFTEEHEKYIFETYIEGNSD
jgi:hypothetical protein